MIRANPEAANILNQNASDISSAACQRLFTITPEIWSEQNLQIKTTWKKHFSQRVTELSTAIATGEPELFSARVNWSGEAMLARGQDSELISSTLQSLKYALIEVLHDNIDGEVISVIDKTDQEIKKHGCKQTESALDAKKPNDRIALEYLQTALEGDSKIASALILQELEKSKDPISVVLDILMPAQREIGRLWHLGGVTIAEEHQVTATTQRCMALICENSYHEPENGYTAICASIAGNVHEIGIRAIGYFLEMAGWKTIYLGVDVPANEFVVTADYYNADIILLSLALSSQLPALRKAISTIRKNKPDLKILVGGNAFADTTGLWKKVGADGYARNAEHAIVLAKEMVTPI
jgi:methanogenic corrinoid protein MtbC1